MYGKQCSPDQMLQSAAYDLGLHCLQRLVCLNTKGYYRSIMQSTIITSYEMGGSKPSLFVPALYIIIIWEKFATLKVPIKAAAEDILKYI